MPAQYKCLGFQSSNSRMTDRTTITIVITAKGSRALPLNENATANLPTDKQNLKFTKFRTA